MTTMLLGRLKLCNILFWGLSALAKHQRVRSSVSHWQNSWPGMDGQIQNLALGLMGLHV